MRALYAGYGTLLPPWLVHYWASRRGYLSSPFTKCPFQDVLKCLIFLYSHADDIFTSHSTMCGPTPQTARLGQGQTCFEWMDLPGQWWQTAVSWTRPSDENERFSVSCNFRLASLFLAFSYPPALNPVMFVSSLIVGVWPFHRKYALLIRLKFWGDIGSLAMEEKQGNPPETESIYHRGVQRLPCDRGIPVSKCLRISPWGVVTNVCYFSDDLTVWAGAGVSTTTTWSTMRSQVWHTVGKTWVANICHHEAQVIWGGAASTEIVSLRTEYWWQKARPRLDHNSRGRH